MSDFDDISLQAYLRLKTGSTDPVAKALGTSVRKALLTDFGAKGDANKRRKALQKDAERIRKLVRGKRREYEAYLYQAIGRKVDFEETKLESSEGAQYNVVAKYLVQKDTSEPLAPRFYVDLRIVPKEGEFEDQISITLNAGFINAIGMQHTKFTQDDFSEAKLENPADVFGWIEYLEGDFLKARRLVRPFGGGKMDMGTKD